MKRYAELTLENWINECPEKICLITGFRGVGKTWIAREFSSAVSSKTVYFNFESDCRLRSRAESDEVRTIEDLIRLELNLSDMPEGFFFVFDEIGYSDKICRLLFDPASSSHNGNVILALSDPSVAERYRASELEHLFYVTLGTVSFDEFLSATSRDWYKDVIVGHFESNKKIPGIVHNELMDIFYEYLRIGGMPGVIASYLDDEDMLDVEERQKSFFNDILVDNDNIAPIENGFKRKQLLQSVSDQFLKGNRRFRFTDIRKGVTYGYFADAIDELDTNGFIYRVNRLSDDDENQSLFRLYYRDHGLLNSRLRSMGCLNDNDLFKYLLENYIVCELGDAYPIKFWESSGSAAVDHVLCDDGGYIPIECFYPGMARTKGMASFLNLFRNECKESYIITEDGFSSLSGTRYIPYYSIFCLKKRNLLK